MSVFVRKDPKALACRERSWPGELFAMLGRHVRTAAALLLLAALAYAGNIAAGFHTAAQTQGTISGLPLLHPVTIARDGRGIPHIRAQDVRDLFFAQGFAEASDRLFQMDMTRRYAYGTLAGVFGARALSIDERMRAADIARISERQWRAAGSRLRMALQAFSEGVNAARAREPLPVEFRMLLYRPSRWRPQDSIAVALVAAYELGDSWYEVIARDYRMRALGARCYAADFPLSDSRYDVTPAGRPIPGGSPRVPRDCLTRDVAITRNGKPRLGSNAWVAGADRSADHHALIANDPHADLTIPGIWYVVDLRAPGFHVAGAVIPGLPGVALGHNEHIAWAATNAQVTTSAVYRAPPHLSQRYRKVERFDVRFGAPVFQTYYRTGATFSIAAGEDGDTYLVRWPQYTERHSSIDMLLALDAAKTLRQALRVLSRYRGAPQNFMIAGAGGSVAYHLAGAIYDDPAWGRYVHPAREIAAPLHELPFSALPAHAPSRAAVLLSANNRMYGPRYPFRLTAAFEPPYRAYRIAALLRARRTYSIRYFERMQMDVCSPVDAEIAREVARITRNRSLAHWNGCFSPSSRAASQEYALRETLTQDTPIAALLAQLRHPDPYARGGVYSNLPGALWPPETRRRWARAGRVAVEHPLSPYWYGLLAGTALPGDGDGYTVHLQEPGFAQGFRAVWDTGNWDAGGIDLPSGESGEPGSGHYDDMAAAWIRGTLVSLPFSRAAVARATVSRLRLERRSSTRPQKSTSPRASKMAYAKG